MTLEAYGRCSEMTLLSQEEVQLQDNFISGCTWHTEWYKIEMDLAAGLQIKLPAPEET